MNTLNNGEVNLRTKRHKFLVVEDDVSAWMLWEQIIRNVDSQAVVKWATTEEGAEKLIRDGIKGDDEFDIAIVDVLLAGPKNGVDLWNMYSHGGTAFLFASCIAKSKFLEMVEGTMPTYAPGYIQKPLDPVECSKVLHSVLEKQKVQTHYVH